MPKGPRYPPGHGSRLLTERGRGPTFTGTCPFPQMVIFTAAARQFGHGSQAISHSENAGALPPASAMLSALAFMTLPQRFRL
jgi:hypothetical protein